MMVGRKKRNLLIAVIVLMVISFVIYEDSNYLKIYPVYVKVLITDYAFRNTKSVNGSFQHTHTSPTNKKNDKVIPSAVPASPTFAFITQTEECLPRQMRTNEYVGNVTLCDCRVYVTSYQRQCLETPSPGLSHVKYIFKPGIAWSKGRNTALQAAKDSHFNFLYYICVDDDIVFSYNEFTPKTLVAKKVPPLRIFTAFLLDFQPAGAGTDYIFWNQAPRMYDHWHNVCKNSSTPKVLPVGHIDACVVAFHRNTIETVLPYPEEYDAQSFWTSTLQVTLGFQIAFYGQLTYFSEIQAINPKHRYSEGNGWTAIGDMNIRRAMVEYFRQRAPPQYRTSKVFDMAMNYQFPGNTAHTLCLEPPKSCTPVIPYGIMPP